MGGSSGFVGWLLPQSVAVGNAGVPGEGRPAGMCGEHLLVQWFGVAQYWEGGQLREWAAGRLMGGVGHTAKPSSRSAGTFSMLWLPPVLLQLCLEVAVVL